MAKVSDGKLYGGLAALVVALLAVVVWAIPSARELGANADDGGIVETHRFDADAPSSERKGALARPLRASLELTIVTARSEDEARKLASVSEIARLLGPRQCGDACDAVRKLLGDEDAFEIDVAHADDVLLPGKETWDTVASSLRPEERAKLPAQTTAITVRTNAPFSREHVAARAGFAVTALLAEALDGFVYDETARRIQRWQDSPVIVTPPGAPAFEPRAVVVQLHRQDDGTARVLTLGMMRFGCPDLALEGANMGAAPRLATVLNAVASKLAAGEEGTPITVTLADVARMLGKKPSDLNASTPRPVELDVIAPERAEGDPDNEIAELVPSEGSSREAWDTVLASLFGVPASVSNEVEDRELGEIAGRAKKELPRVVGRFETAGGELFVKGPFVIPPDARLDGGPTTELLWVDVAACDPKLCTGVLANDPTWPSNLASAKTTSVERAHVADWLLRERDGGTTGGESLRVLRARSSGK